MKRLFAALSSVSVVLATSLGMLLLFSLSIPFDDTDEPEMNGYAVNALSIPDSLYFAGERVPLENFDTRESLDRELLVNTYFHSQTLMYIKRANRFFPLIEKLLKQYSIPEDFKYLAVAESGLMNATSPAGAVGFWQFLEGTAKDYGLIVNGEVDERYHVEKSTIAACRFLQESYEKYGNWTMVAASYNNGRRGLEKQVDIQKENNYYDLLLNEETARYVFRILAIKLVISNPEEYGFLVGKEDLYMAIPTYRVKVDHAIEDFAKFAKEKGTNYKILKYLNPWLRKPSLQNTSKHIYWIELPRDGARKTWID